MSYIFCTLDINSEIKGSNIFHAVLCFQYWNENISPYFGLFLICFPENWRILSLTCWNSGADMWQWQSTKPWSITTGENVSFYEGKAAAKQDINTTQLTANRKHNIQTSGWQRKPTWKQTDRAAKMESFPIQTSRHEDPEQEFRVRLTSKRKTTELMNRCCELLRSALDGQPDISEDSRRVLVQELLAVSPAVFCWL